MLVIWYFCVTRWPTCKIHRMFVPNLVMMNIFKLLKLLYADDMVLFDDKMTNLVVTFIVGFCN